VALGNLASRFLVAVVAAPVLLLAIYYHRPEPLWAIVFGASLVAMYEFFSMTLPDRIDRSASLVIGGATCAALYWLHPKALPIHLTHAQAEVFTLTGWTVALVVAIISCFLYFLFRFTDIQTVGSRMAFGITGIIYGGFLATFMILTRRDLTHGSDVLVLILLLAWVGDTGAYFAGRFLGERKLYPAVSPKKTWAGAIGGLLGSVVAAVVMKLLRLPELAWFDVVAIAIPASILGQLGDLAESLFKRSVGVKDSGSLLPGHGGILDRIDAVLFIAPYTYLYLTLRVALA